MVLAVHQLHTVRTHMDTHAAQSEEDVTHVRTYTFYLYTR
jgi:hypothetical protein